MSGRTSTSTVLTVAGLTIVGGFIAYAAYFDYKRRSDPSFRKKIRTQKKKVQQHAAKDAEKKPQEGPTANDQLPKELIQALHEKANEDKVPTELDERHRYFVTLVGQAEILAAQGPEGYLEAALYFYQALRAYPSPAELIEIYQKSVPEPIYMVITELYNLDVSHRKNGYYERFPPKKMNVSIRRNIPDESKDIQPPICSLIATKDFKAGEEIYTETPIVAVLDADLQGRGTHCSHCLRHIEKGMAIVPESDRLNSVYCSKKCQMQAKSQHHNLLFGDEEILPINLGMDMPEAAKEARPKMQDAFVEFWKGSGSSGLLLTSRLVALQIIAELAKAMPHVSGLKADLPELSVDTEYTVYDHMERLRFIDVEIPEGEHKTLNELMVSTLPFLDNGHPDERHTLFRGKMAYNAIGVVYAGGRTDKPALDEKAERTRTPYGTAKQVGSGLYFVSSYLNHSCSPSTRPSFSSGTSELHLIATRDIKEGEELTMAYVDVSQHEGETMAEARDRRRKELALGWVFACACKRCEEEGKKLSEESTEDVEVSPAEDGANAEATLISRWSEEPRVQIRQSGNPGTAPAGPSETVVVVPSSVPYTLTHRHYHPGLPTPASTPSSSSAAAMSQTTMKTIQTTKRLYTIASPPSKAAKAASSHLRRSRANSASASSQQSSSSPPVGSPSSSGADRRTLHTSATGYPNPLHYFDSPPTPPPPTSRPGNPHVVSTQRLPSGESQTSHGTSPNGGQQQGGSTGPNPHPQGQQGNAQGQSQPLLGSTTFTLTVAPPSPPAGSSPSERNFALNAARGSFASQSWSSKTADGGPSSASDQDAQRKRSSRQHDKPYQLDVGAYGIPKRRRNDGFRGSRRRHQLSTDVMEEFALGDWDLAEQVGEDAYFVREDAMGVADGVGGWNSRGNCAASSSTSTSPPAYVSSSGHNSHNYDHFHRHPPSQPSPSALFSRRLMHFCSLEVREARLQMTASDLSPPPPSNPPKPPKVPYGVSQPSLKTGGLFTRDQAVDANGVNKGKIANARPFAWPWEVEQLEQPIQIDSYPDFTLGMDSLSLGEENPSMVSAGDSDVSGIDAMAAALGATNSEGLAYEDKLSVIEEDDVIEEPAIIDPVDVLERAYNRTLAAHKRRVIRTQERRRMEEEVPSPERLNEGFWSRLGFGLHYFSPSLEDSPFNPSVNSTKPSSEADWEPLLAGSSTALLAILCGDCLRVAHLGDCSGLLVRNGEIVWRSEEMWWKFNYPLQLGPVSPTHPRDARSYEIKVQKDDILILASDGMSDNLWEEDVLDEVRRLSGISEPSQESDQAGKLGLVSAESSTSSRLLGRKTLAGMLSEALCSRARVVSERARAYKQGDVCGGISSACDSERGRPAGRNLADEPLSGESKPEDSTEDEVPFARRAREEGKNFRGGKCDDISVLVAVVSPAAAPLSTTTH